MTEFYLVRHAHANWMPDEARPLSASGVTDTQRVTEVLQPFPINAIYASPYQRAYQTIEPFATQKNIPITTLHNLRERLLSSVHFNGVDAFDEAIKTVWHNPSFAYPGGESNNDAQKRGITLITRLRQQHPQDHVVLATHGNLMALILQHFNPSLGYSFWKSLQMPDIYRLSLTADNTATMTRIPAD